MPLTNLEGAPDDNQIAHLICVHLKMLWGGSGFPFFLPFSFPVVTYLSGHFLSNLHSESPKASDKVIWP